jgi:hypothetical protein
MKYINFFFAMYFMIYGLLMAFQLVPISYFTIGCLAVIAGLSFLNERK